MRVEKEKEERRVKNPGMGTNALGATNGVNVGTSQN